MVKTLLFIDDYNELMYVQTFLRKLGIDVDGVQNTKKLDEIVMSFNPKIIIATAHGKVVDGIQIAKSIHRKNGFPRLCLLKGSGVSLSADEAAQIGVDAILESPVNVRKLIEVVGKLGDIDQKLLLEKFAKIQSSVTPKSEDSHKEFKSADSSFSLKKTEAQYDLDQEDQAIRKRRYKSVLNSLPKENLKSLPRDQISKFNQDMRKTPLPDDHVQVEAERLEFVKSLFKKAKG